ncbi:DUF5709 domain-containing protein [Granulicoccus sp. GXG6511]|uniref:DUF5709 domain-containing protein n=1 Tax=Granulicoccus sp. GXG6511 TaxID=3381351 RepID=UPI003D7E04D1
MSTDNDQFIDEMVPDGSEQLDQLESDRTLIDRGIADPMEEGYIPPDDWSVAEGFGNTVAEMRQGETLEQRIKQEMPEADATDDGEYLDDKEVGRRRAGRLVDANQGYPGEDRESQLIGTDVGIDGAAATAEEAAMHIIDEDEIDRDIDD